MKVRGTVVRGDGRGRTLGYATANVAVPDTLTAASGVYAAFVEFDDGGKRYPALANLGVKPTFSEELEENTRILELHLLDFEGDLYGRELTAELVEFIRHEQKFPTTEALLAQISKDEKIVRGCLNFSTDAVL